MVCLPGKIRPGGGESSDGRAILNSGPRFKFQAFGGREKGDANNRLRIGKAIPSISKGDSCFSVAIKDGDQFLIKAARELLT